MHPSIKSVMGWKGALVTSSQPHMKVAASTCDLWLDTLPVPQAKGVHICQFHGLLEKLLLPVFEPHYRIFWHPCEELICDHRFVHWHFSYLKSIR